MTASELTQASGTNNRGDMLIGLGFAAISGGFVGAFIAWAITYLVMR